MKPIIKFISKEIQSYSALDIFKFFGNFLLTFLYSALTLYIAVIIQDSLSFYDFKSITKTNWLTIIFGSLFLVMATYIRERIITKKKEDVIMGKNIAFRLIQNAIESISQCNMRSTTAKENTISEILKTIEHSVSVVLYELGLSVNRDEQICANLMVFDESENNLELKFFGTKWGGREIITLAINEHYITPGAPQAFLSEKVIYIKNTMSRTYKKYFSNNKPYRSIISIPLYSQNNEKFGVLNIDSDEINKFGSKDIVDKKILPTLNPYFSLFKLMEKSIIN